MIDKSIMFSDSYGYRLDYKFESEEHFQEVLDKLRTYDMNMYMLRGDMLDGDYNSAFDIMDNADRVVVKCIGNKLKYQETDFEELDV